MRQRKKNIQNQSLPKTGKPISFRDAYPHFPEEGILNFELANEIGLSTITRSIHRQVNVAGLLNQYPIRAYQYLPTGTDSDEKSKLNRKFSKQISNSFRDFRVNKPSEEHTNNAAEVIWAAGHGSLAI
jgi:hypothetical protein